MAYTAGNFDSIHHYLQWGGKLPGGEVWSCGMRLAHVGNFGSNQTYLDSVAAVVSGFHANPLTSISSRALLTFVKCNEVGVDGKYASDATYEKVMANVPGAASAQTTPPNQVTLAVSLLTGFSRGAAHRGRFYLPIPILNNLEDTGLITAAHRDEIKGSCSQFVTAVNAISPGLQVAVFSRKAGAAAHRLVSAVAVGRVADTQRRRRNNLVENY